MPRRAALVVLGMLASVTALIGLAQARIQRACGHRQPMLSFFAGELGLGDRSHDEVDRAAGRWAKQRTAGDFNLILDHLARGTPAAHLRAILGEPDRRSRAPQHDPGHAQRSHESWAYHLEGGPRGEDRLLGGDAQSAADDNGLVGPGFLDGFHAAEDPLAAVQIEAPQPVLRAERLDGDLAPLGEDRRAGGGPDGKELQAAPPTRVRERVGVFNVEVEEPHNFFAGGFLVHNKSRNRAK